MTSAAYSTVSGVITIVRQNGARLAGVDRWLNISRFAPEEVWPEPGTEVIAELDAQGFVRRIVRPAPPLGPLRADDAPMPERMAIPPQAVNALKDRLTFAERARAVELAAQYLATIPPLPSDGLERFLATAQTILDWCAGATPSPHE